MSTTAFLGKALEIVALLQAAPALAGGRVYLGRDAPMPTHHDSEIRVGIESSSGRQITMDGTTQWDTVFGVELRARVAAGGNGVQAIDDLLDAAYARLAAPVTDATQEPWHVDPTLRWQIEEGDTPVVTVGLAVRVQHITGAGTLQAAT